MAEGMGSADFKLNEAEVVHAVVYLVSSQKALDAAFTGFTSILSEVSTSGGGIKDQQITASLAGIRTQAVEIQSELAVAYSKLAKSCTKLVAEVDAIDVFNG